VTGLDQSEMLGGFQVVAPNIRFDSSVAEAGGSDGGNAGNAAPIPSFFYVNAVTDRLRLGFSVAGIMGGGVDYGDRFVGRYATSMAEVGAVGISPAINQSAVGASDGKLKIVKADDRGYQPYVGLTYHVTDRAMLGFV